MLLRNGRTLRAVYPMKRDRESLSMWTASATSARDLNLRSHAARWHKNVPNTAEELNEEEQDDLFAEYDGVPTSAT